MNIKSLFQKLLFSFGKKYKVDDKIPNRLLLKTLFLRFFMLVRGYLFYRGKIFLGKGVKLYNKKNIFIGQNTTLESRVKIDGFCAQKLIIGKNSKIGAYSEIKCTSHFSKYGKGLEIGNNFGIGKFAFFGCSGKIKIGDNVIMGEYVSFHSENHNFSNTNKLIKDQGVTSKGITLGNDIWVGAKVTFLDGSEVGSRCVIAAGAVVKDKFPNNVIIGGVPAKIIKHI